MVGAKIKTLRLQKEWSQQDVADKLNISQSAYAKVERGESKLDVARIIKLSEIFDIEPYELLVPDGKVISINSDNAQGYVNNYYYSDLKASQDNHIETLKQMITTLREEVLFWKNKANST